MTFRDRCKSFLSDFDPFDYGVGERLNEGSNDDKQQ